MEEFNIIPNRKQNFFQKTVFPTHDTGIPFKHDYIFIKKVDTPNGISYHGGNDVIHDFWYLGKGGWRWQDIKMLFFYLFALRINIH